MTNVISLPVDPRRTLWGSNGNRYDTDNQIVVGCGRLNGYVSEKTGLFYDWAELLTMELHLYTAAPVVQDQVRVGYLEDDLSDIGNTYLYVTRSDMSVDEYLLSANPDGTVFVEHTDVDTDTEGLLYQGSRVVKRIDNND